MEESTAGQGSSQSVPLEQLQEGTGETEFELPFDLSGMDPKKLEMADKLLEGTGFSIKDLASWANGVEVRLQLMQKSLPNKEQIEDALEQAIENVQKKQIAAMKKAGVQPTPTGGSGGFMEQMFMKMLMGGGGQDEEVSNLTKEMYKLNITAMKEDIGFTRAIKNALVSKIAGKAAGALGDMITKEEK